MPIVAMAIGAVVAIVVLAIISKAVWRVPGPDEALIISGLGVDAESPGFRVVTGKGTMVLPGLQTCRRLSLATRTADLEVTCVNSQGTTVRVRGEVGYRVGDGLSSIADAARRFLDQEELMDDPARQAIAGHLRSVVGTLTVDDLLRDRERLADQVRSSSAGAMGKLGLAAVSLRLREIDDLGKAGKAGSDHSLS
jgi:flotillin